MGWLKESTIGDWVETITVPNVTVLDLNQYNDCLFRIQYMHSQYVCIDIFKKRPLRDTEIKKEVDKAFKDFVDKDLPEIKTRLLKKLEAGEDFSQEQHCLYTVKKLITTEAKKEFLDKYYEEV